MKRFIIILCLLALTAPVFVSATTTAAATNSSTTVTKAPPSFWPIVPCGLKTQPKDSSGTVIDKNVWDYTQDCNQCLLILLFKNLIDMVVKELVPILGTFFFLVGGFMILLGSAKPAWIQKGKSIMWDTAIGIVIILCSYLITNFILKSLAGDTSPYATGWNVITCKVSTLKDITDATLPHPGGPPPAAQKYSCQSNQCTADTSGTYTESTCGGACQPAPPVPPPTGGAQCLQSGLNLCQASAPQGCFNSVCSQYATMIQNQATGAATASVLKSFMEVESSCNIAAASGTSYGLMQISPATGNIYASRCGVTSVDQAWLTNPVNAEKSICIAAQYINAIAESQCGSSTRNLYAGYNGGQKGDTSACAPSVDCTSQTSCDGSPVKRWECLYDDTAHQVCNGGTDIMLGYNQTRQGATRAIACAANPGF